METRVIKLLVVPKGQPMFDERATTVEIDDEAAGEFIKVRQPGSPSPEMSTIAFDTDEWPAIRDAIERLIGDCRDNGKSDT